MIDDTAPDSWRDLQERVARILSECGIATAIEKVVETARGKVEIDVWAHDSSSTPPQTYLVECKRWCDAVPQTVVHAFRTVVGDSGANWGAIVSSNGFQSGAYEAARYSNVRLLSWLEYQNLFAESWFEHHFCRLVGERCDPLVEYTEPINSRIFKKADLLSESQRKEFVRLREAHLALAVYCMLMRSHSIGALRIALGTPAPSPMPSLPLRAAVRDRIEALGGVQLPDPVLDAMSYRGLLAAIIAESEKAIEQFDAVFGERA